MLNRNLIAIIVVMLGLVMASSAFGQRGGTGKRPDKKNPDFNKNEHIIKPMYVANQEEYMAGGIADIRGGTRDLKESFEQNSNARTKRNNSVPKPNAQITHDPEFEAMVGRKQNSTKTVSQVITFPESHLQSPRDVASGQVTSIQEVYEAKGGTLIKSPRGAATGQATGKRQHKPI